MSDRIHQSDRHYRNPTYDKSFPDPFVLKHNGIYYAYCTGHWAGGGVFGVLRSRDLVDWEPVGGAMAELGDGSPYYWAPEVTYWNGSFYLYYSVGNETLMQLRVAVSDRPDGGFVDSGRRLTSEDFAIDAHVFIDDGGQRYLFYATDFLEHTHIGTGVVADRMLDWFTLEGRPHPVVRAKYDWQVYDPQRKEKGGVRWHTVEGPFVLKRKGRYFMMFSAGNWQQPTYGVSFAVTGDLEAHDEWRQFSDGDKILPILRTTPDEQVGPGHNSVIRGPNNRETYCVYHYWHNDERVLAVNRMDFAGPRIFIEDKPYLEKDFPLMPSGKFGFTAETWRSNGTWNLEDGRIRNSGTAAASLESAPLPPSLLCEFGVRAGKMQDGGRFGLRFESGTKVLGGFSFVVKENEPHYEWIEPNEERSGPLTFGSEFRLDVLHRLTVNADGKRLCVKLDDGYLSFNSSLPAAAERIVLFTSGAEAEFSAFELTSGFEDLFETDQGNAAERLGWTVSTGAADVSVRDRELRFNNPEEIEAILSKGEAAADFEFAANIRLKGPAEPEGAYGFVLLDEDNGVIERFLFAEINGRMSITDGQAVPMPFDFNTRLFHQIRFLKRSGKLSFDIESVPLGTRSVTSGKAKIGIFSRNSTVALEMVRHTVLEN